MSTDVDLVVIGAGPAGCRAALAASSVGLRVALIDEAEAAGGQIYRAPSTAAVQLMSRKVTADAAEGDALRREVASSRVETYFRHRVYSVARGFSIAAAVGPETRQWRARALIVATGTTERVAPFPGWTLPGVIGLGAATILLKSQATLPGNRTVVAGCGPLVTAVAAGILEKGGTVAAVVDLASPADWLRLMPRLATRPAMLARGVGWLRGIRRARVPIYTRHAVVGIEGDDQLSGVVIQPVDKDWRRLATAAMRRIPADAAAIGHGLVPSTEVTRLVGADHAFRDDVGGWIAVTDGDGRTSVPGLFAAGDCAGVAGADPAERRGTIAGLAVARDLGRLGQDEFARRAAPARAMLARTARFGSAAAALMRPRPGLWSVATPETVLCRCEDITRQEIDAARDSGARHVDDLKVWTRCGMGACQGRYCGEAAAVTIAGGADRAAAGQWTIRFPLRPVSMAALANLRDPDAT